MNAQLKVDDSVYLWGYLCRIVFILYIYVNNYSWPTSDGIISRCNSMNNKLYSFCMLFLFFSLSEKKVNIQKKKQNHLGQGYTKSAESDSETLPK